MKKIVVTNHLKIYWKRFKEIDIKFEGKKRVEDEFKMAIDKLESEDEKFNFDLKNQKKKMEKS